MQNLKCYTVILPEMGDLRKAGKEFFYHKKERLEVTLFLSSVHTY